MGKNHLTGSIPPEIKNFILIQGINLSENDLTGTIPSEIGNLENIDGLDPSNNNLTGTIPAEIGDLNTTTYLYLHENQLEGEIPSEITKLEALIDGQGLNLKNNCNLCNNDILVQSFISDKSSSFSGYPAIEASNGNCPSFNLAPVISYLLD